MGQRVEPVDEEPGKTPDNQLNGSTTKIAQERKVGDEYIDTF